MNAAETITSRAPVRFDFSGGPSDVSPFKDKEAGLVFNTALQMYASVIVTPNSSDYVHIHSEDLNKSEDIRLGNEIDLNGSLNLIKAIVSYISPKNGIDIKTSVETPLGSGLGSSAALAVACIAALRTFNGESIDDKRILAEDALFIENVLLKNINGGQDQYAAALGGFSFFEFENNKVKIDSIDIDKSVIRKLEESSFFCYSGESRLSGNVLQEIMSHYNNGDSVTTNAIHNIRSLAVEMRECLQEGKLSEYGLAIERALISQRNLHPKLVTPNIEKVISIAKSFGACSAKIAGAGGGGCVYIYADKSAAITRDTLDKNGYLTLPFKVEAKGVTVT